MKINSERPMSKEHANTFEGLFELKPKRTQMFMHLFSVERT